jgi:thiamine-phosphate pyrophosphorylase
VNERLDVALATGAAGVHLRGDSLPASRARTLAPAGFLIGRSVHSEEEAVRVEAAGGCDYLLFGTVLPSGSKSPSHQAVGLAALERVCRRVRLPVLAIGGMTVAAASAVRDAGAAGMAAIGLFKQASDLPGMVRALRSSFTSDVDV